MNILKYILLVFFAMVYSSLPAQDEIVSRKQERIQKRQDKKEQRQIRRESRKEDRQSKKYKTVEYPKLQLHDTAQTEPAVVTESAVSSNPAEQKQSAVQHEDNVSQLKENEMSSQNIIAPTAVSTQIKGVESGDCDKSNNDAVSSDSSDNSSAIPAILFILAVVGLFRYLFYRKCPNCKTKLSMRDINEEFMGHTRQTREKGNNGKYYNVYYSNIKVTRKCSHCGYVDYVIQERKGNGKI